MLAVVTYKYSNLNLGLGSDRTGILIAWSEYHSKMVSVSEALRKWDQLAPSVLDIYYEFMYNYVTILIDVWMSGIEINFFKIKKSIHKKLSMLKKFEYARTKFWGSRWTRH